MKFRWKFRPDPNLVAFFIGLCLFAGGLYLVYPPSALIGPGIILMAISLFGGRQK